MDCIKCNANIPEEDAIFCGECGARLDGKRECTSCRKLVDERYAYCLYCGQRIDGKIPCPTCGEYSDGAYCSKCGTLLKAAPTAQVKSVPTALQEGKERLAWWTPLFAWLRSGAGITCALFALIFVFLIGFAASVNGEIASLLGSTVDGERNMYYFFGDAYKELAELKASGGFKSTIPLVSGYIYAVLGTVISSATILCVVAFSTVAIIGFVKFSTGRVENNAAKWGVRAAIAYLVGALALYALNAVSIRLSLDISSISSTEASSINIQAALVLDGATKAGVTLCALFLGVYAVVNLVRKGREWKQPATIVRYALWAVSAGLIAAIFAIIKGGYVGFEVLSEQQSLLASISTHSKNTWLIAIAEQEMGAAFYNENLGTILTSVVCSWLEQACLLAVLVCVAVSLADGLFSTENVHKEKGLILAIISLVLAVLMLVFGCIGQTYFGKIAVAADDIEHKLALGAAIATVVLALLNLGVNIARSVLKKREMIER